MVLGVLRVAPLGRLIDAAPEALRSLADGSYESPAHPVTIMKTCVAGDNVHGVSAFLQQRLGGLDPQLFDGFCR